jgi:hypothetical protein
MPSKVFISYRREDSRYQARRVYDAFVHALPPDTVFMDVDSIPPGADFVEILEGWVQQCDVLLALIGPNWLSSIDPRTSLRRLDSPEDFVRIEVRGALQRKIPVVPVLLDNTEMPTAAELPDDIKALRRRHAEFVDFRTFDADVQRLIKRLKIGKEIKLPGGAPAPQATSDANRLTSVATTNTLLERIKPNAVVATPQQLMAVAALLLVVGVVTYVVNAGTHVDASDLARSEAGRRAAEEGASQAADAHIKAEKARQEAETKADAAAAALVRAEENRIAAEARANDAAEAVKKSDNARLDAEARADNSRQLAEARANDAADALKKSEKARQDAEAKLVAAQAKVEELRKIADARPSPALPQPTLRPTVDSLSSSSRKLLADIGSKSRWAMDGSMCNNTKDANFLSLEVGNGSVTWVSGLGRVETETILASSENEFRTRSSQQLLAYSRHGESSIYVQSSRGAAFFLERCP